MVLGKEESVLFREVSYFRGVLIILCTHTTQFNMGPDKPVIPGQQLFRAY